MVSVAVVVVQCQCGVVVCVKAVNACVFFLFFFVGGVCSHVTCDRVTV